MTPDPLLSRIGEALLERDRDRRPRWYSDPVLFATECLEWPEGQALTAYQGEILAALVEHRRVAVRSPHGAGKSALCALVILWFALSRDLALEDWKVLTTAGSWRQLVAYLWPEIALWSRRFRWDVIGRPPFDPRTELMLTTLRLSHGQAFAGASDDPQLLEGMHSDQVLVVFDEAKSIVAGTWEAMEGALAGQGTSLALAVSTPGSPSGVFFDIHSRKLGYEDWAVRHVTFEEAIAADRISATWASARRRQWGEASAVFKNRVEGLFASSDEDSVIALPWIEQANDRWQGWKDSTEDPGPVTVAGVDVARMGADQTVVALRHQDIVTELRRSHHEDTMATAGRVVGVLEANPGARAVVDVIGLGSGVVDRLRELGFKRTVAFNASSGTTRKDRSGELGFVNTRSAAWWWLREQLDPTFEPVLALPPDDLLIGDLSAPRYSVTSSGKIQVESKDEIRKRLGRSTDSGDAVVQACFDAARGAGAGWMEYFQQQTAEDKEKPPAPARRPAILPLSDFLLGRGVPISRVDLSARPPLLRARGALRRLRAMRRSPLCRRRLPSLRARGSGVMARHRGRSFRRQNPLRLWKAEAVPLSIPVLPERYLEAGELLAAYVGGDEKSFYRIAEKLRPDVVIALLEGTRVCLELLAEDHGWSLQQAAEVYRNGAEAAAEARQ